MLLCALSEDEEHPTSVPEEDLFTVSADYPGYYYEHLESLAGNDCLAMFLNGAAGDQTCGEIDGITGWARTEAIGVALAELTFEAAAGNH